MAESAAVSGTGREGLEGDPSRGSRGVGLRDSEARAEILRAWWPLALLILLAAGLRLGTLNLQSFWYDEAFTPVHVLHASLGATLRAFVHTENTPPLWYVTVWGWARLFGTGEVALRLPSALAGIATVPVAWGIGSELAGRRAAIVAAALVAVNPLFVWYSQEARAYAFFVLFVALAMLCVLRADREPTPRRLALFALSGALALLSQYFAVFLLIPMALWLLRPRRAGAGETGRPSAGAGAAGTGVAGRGAGGAGAVPTSGTSTPMPAAARLPRLSILAAVAALALVGLALVPLIVAQGGHGTQWIGQWPLSERLEAVPQYYLTGYSGAPLGHGIELLVALPILAGIGFALWRVLTPRESDGALLALAIAACGALIPLALALGGADYLAPRNLVAAMIPLTAMIAVLVAARRTGAVGMAIAGVIALAFLALSVDVDLSPRLQRGDWRGLARVLSAGGAGGGERAITTVELGAAPLEYYLPPLHNLARDTQVRVREIDETGYAPLRLGAGAPPASGFRLVGRYDVNGLVLYRFRSPVPRTVSEVALRTHVITLAHPEVLVPGRGGATVGAP
jgi:hypothetical protein